jgi:hypothetical protein
MLVGRNSSFDNSDGNNQAMIGGLWDLVFMAMLLTHNLQSSGVS